tara:strand:+ start:68 stop:442 length:375 start_codon:yes stop_codon:yes gene_type:complete
MHISSNKSFGIVFFAVFIIISFFPLLKNEEIKIWALLIGLIFLILGLLKSRLLTPLNKIWFKFGIFLGNFISPIVMGLVFFTVVTPIAIIMKTFGKDVLNLKKSNKKSYWIKKSSTKGKMSNQF